VLVAVDVDPRNGGDDQLADLERQLGPLPYTPRSLTGGGGLHVLLAHPGVPLVARLAPGVEIKDLGYIVAPPSITERRYEWEIDLDDAPPAPVPAAWLARMTYRSPQPRGTRTPTGRATQRQDRIPASQYVADLAGLDVGRDGKARCPFHDLSVGRAHGADVSPARSFADASSRDDGGPR